MRKVSFGLFSIFCVLLFNSCLGDSNSTLKSDFDYGFIKRSNQGVIYAAVAANGTGAYITSEQIENLTVGDCVTLGYTISSDGTVSNNIMTATNVFIESVLPQSVIKKTTPNGLYTNSLRKLDLRKYSVNSFYGDRWFLSANYPLKTGEKLEDIIPHCYYDIANQPKDEDGNVLSNKIIIDVRFSNINPNTDPNALITAETYLFALDLSPLRTMYSPDYSSIGTGGRKADVQIQFRYLQEQTDGTVKEDYLGVWNSANSYYMLFE